MKAKLRARINLVKGMSHTLGMSYQHSPSMRLLIWQLLSGFDTSHSFNVVYSLLLVLYVIFLYFTRPS